MNNQNIFPTEFVEPVQFDLGRIFSECGPSQPIVFTVKGPNQAKSDIRKFAEEKERDLIQLSMGSNDVRPRLFTSLHFKPLHTNLHASW